MNLSSEKVGGGRDGLAPVRSGEKAAVIEPYYDEGGITLYNARWEDVLPTLGRFDLIFTSPPFNLGASPWKNLGNWKTGDSENKGKWANGSDGVGGMAYSHHGDAMPWAEYEDWQRSFLTEAWKHVSPAGAMFYNHKPRLMGGRLWLPLTLNPGLPLRQIIIWARSGGLNFNPTAFVPTHEWVMVFAKEDWRLKSRAAAGIGGGDVWKVVQDRRNEHPAPFPVALPALAIEAANPTNVLDPYVGSGTTLLAAKRAGIVGVGIEVDEAYCELAVRRLQAVESEAS